MSDVYTKYQPPSEAGIFTKIQGGESVKLRLASEPYIFDAEYKDKETGEVSYNTRYAWVCYNYTEKKAQIFATGVTVYRAIAALAADPEWGDPTKYGITVSREGTGFQDTKYHVTPSPNKFSLDNDQQAEVDKLDIKQAVTNGNPVLLSDYIKKDKQQPPQKDVVIEDLPDDEPVNLDEIPF